MELFRPWCTLYGLKSGSLAHIEDPGQWPHFGTLRVFFFAVAKWQSGRKKNTAGKKTRPKKMDGEVAMSAEAAEAAEAAAAALNEVF